ncbi:MAG: beta-mannosidase [Bacteroidota bacterium]|nr:beta-mannosidase [Bacteroidota bacterium]
MRTCLLILFLSCCLLLRSSAQTADKHATAATKNLFNHLQQTRHAGFLFGHQDDLAYGAGWQYEKDKSDIRGVTGEYPAVYGWELGHLELDSTKNLDGVPFEFIRQSIRKGFERGGVITISWHFTNPLTGNPAWDAKPGAVASILPGASKHALYLAWLDKLAAFLGSLKDAHGNLIPVIFRPFHELNGNWFWWGKQHCSPGELIALYRFTESYLRDTKQLHHLLYAYNTDRFATREEYLDRYPGDDWVDVVGFDIYQRAEGNINFSKELDRMLGTLESIAEEKKKLPALTEFGYNGIPDSSWWTQTFLPAIGQHRIVYALAWRNAGKKTDGSEEYYAPFPGQVSAKDFTLFAANQRVWLQRRAARAGLYTKGKHR